MALGLITLLIISSLLFLLIFNLVKEQKLISSVTKSNRGTKSERIMILKLLKSKYSSKAIFHDLYLINSGGNYTQIDLVLATSVGIIVFEVKDYSGWIFGNAFHKNWTQVLAYGKLKYSFYNPILQNKKHIEDLKNISKQLATIPFYSVIVFFGNCEVRKTIETPRDTFLCKSANVIEIVNKIIQTNEPAKYLNKIEIINLLNAAVLNGEDMNIRQKHIENIRNIFKNH